MQIHTMIWCAYCTKQQQSQLGDSGLVCCAGCGKVVHQHICQEVSNFIDDAGIKVEKEDVRCSACKSNKFDAAKHRGILRQCKTTNAPDDTPHESEKACDGAESLSDIDDVVVSMYLLKEEEKQYKKIIWENLNLDYLQTQAEKKARAAKAGKMKKRQAKASNKGHGGKTTDNMAVKRPSLKVNYDALKQLLDEPEASNSDAKKRRMISATEISKNDPHMEEFYGDHDEGDYNEWDQRGSPYDHGGGAECYGDYEL